MDVDPKEPRAMNPKAVKFLEMDEAEWELRTLQFIMQITADVNRTDQLNPFQDDKKSNHLVKDIEFAFKNTEIILSARLSLQTNTAMNTSLFQYLVATWKQAQDAKYRTNVFYDQNNKELCNLVLSRTALIDSFSKLVIKYCGLVFGNPEAFIEPEM